MSADEVPLGINTAVGAAAAAGAVTLAGLLPLASPGRGVLLTAAVGALAFAVVDPVAAMVTAVVAFALYDGFVEDRSGALGWHTGDLALLGALLAAVALGTAAGALRRRRAERLRHRALEVWANSGGSAPARTQVAQ